MKSMLRSLVAFLCVIAIACSIPKPDLAISKMEQYWQYYKVENYDSLKAFYIPKGENPDEKMSLLFNALHDLHANYGSVKNVNLIETTASNSTENGERIELTYEVEFEKKFISNKFSFAKDETGKFKILDHSFTQ